MSQSSDETPAATPASPAPSNAIAAVPSSPAADAVSADAAASSSAGTVLLIVLVLAAAALFVFALVKKRRQNQGGGPALPKTAGTAAGLPAPAPDTTENVKTPLTEAEKKAAYQKQKEAKKQTAEAKREAEKRAEEEARQKAEAEAAAKKEEAAKLAQAQAGKTLAEGLSKTRGGFIASLTSFFKKGKTIDANVLSELEDVLFSADIGVHTAMKLMDFAQQSLKSKELSDPEKLKAALKEEMRRIVTLDAPPLDFTSARPFVLMVAGVNGAGKTTTIGKLAARLTKEGKKVVLAAGDTFRAAAADQLEVWGQRSGAAVVRGKEGADPGAVVFDAIKKGVSEGADVVIADTAGRLHTKAPLMEEIARVHRVMGKALPGAPHQVLLVLDATNGQNAIAQAREFNAALKLDGIVLTKLDGTAKGGVVIGISDELKIPIRYIGIGEAVEDLREFDGKSFVDALFE